MQSLTFVSMSLRSRMKECFMDTNLFLFVNNICKVCLFVLGSLSILVFIAIIHLDI